ncbi:hypothetical protein SeLEV6574_g07572 [Synchytrium endobioticum]|uniref:Peptidase A2 domain-containing protein n=1 Tax=Synchytrium endobioticum TaxID=286115 RepID=A0A507CH80_9FUNG|nr:hypothetical protein SeLEV6574_g07572 [Synchytrium endobioticum]
MSVTPVDSQLQQRKIDVLYVELDDIRLSPYDSADPAQAKARSTAYQGKMSEIENTERALRAFHKEARQNFTNFTAARNSASFPPGTASGRNVSSTSKSTMKLWDDPKRAGPFTNNPEKPIYQLREEKGYCTQYIAEGRGGIKDKKANSSRLEENGNSGDEGEGLSKIEAVEDTLYEVEGDDLLNASDYYITKVSGSGRTYPPHFLVDVVIQPKGMKKRIAGKALLDSGATRSFIGTKFASRHNIPLETLPKPQRITLADGKPATPIRNQSTLISLTIQTHTEQITLAVFDTKKYDMILGLDWLTFHNPSVDWELRSILFDSYICKHPLGEHSMPQQSRNVIAFSREENTQQIPREPMGIPEVSTDEKNQLPASHWPISEYPILFDMKKQSHLPPHRVQWDFDVNFKPDVGLPKLFRLPQKQRRLVEEYITTELKSGKIRPSNSPVSANLFFVPKGDSEQELRPCVDYRDLNSATIDDKYPLPLIA